MSAAQTHPGTGWCCLFDCPYTPRDFNQGSGVKTALARDWCEPVGLLITINYQTTLGEGLIVSGL